MTTGRRRRANRKGQLAESAAVLYLVFKGYRILARRYRTRVGEIDIVARRRRRLAFVEVKIRDRAEDALWSVTAKQQGRIARAAELWLARRPEFGDLDICFDVVLMSPWRFPRHLRSAFDV